MRTRRLAVYLGIALVVLVAVAAAAWYLFIRDSGAFSYVIRDEPPPPVSLAAALEAPVLATPVAGEEDLVGTWRVLEGESSFAGYRVVETLASFGTNTAVGRTKVLEGTLEFDGNAITQVEVTADLSALTSNQGERDEQLATQAIETATYPTATFVLTGPVQVEEIPPEGERTSETVSGELTLHGVTREVDVDVEAALSGGRLVVVGETEIAFADFNIQEPTSFSVLSTEDHGVMEFQLIFEQA